MNSLSKTTSLKEETGQLYPPPSILNTSRCYIRAIWALNPQKGGQECVYSVNKDVETAVQACSVCNSLKPHQQREPLRLHTVPDLPWSIVTTDIFEWENHHYLVLMDSYSGWFEVDHLGNMSYLCIIYKLKRHFSVHGIPKRCVQTCVRGSETRSLMASARGLWGVQRSRWRQQKEMEQTFTWTC